MKDFLARYRTLVLALMVQIAIMSVAPMIVPQVFVLLLLLFFTVKREVPSFLILYYLVLLFSDSKQESMWWAMDAKIPATLLLPINLFAVRKDIKLPSRFTSHILPFLIIAFVTLFFAFDPVMSAQKTLSYTFIVICVPALFLYCFQRDEKFLSDVMFVFMSILGIGLILFFVKPDFVVMEDSGRFTGLLGNPNGMGIFITMAFLYFQVLKRSGIVTIKKTDQYIFYLVLFYSLYLCKSRTSMMTVMIFYALNAIYNYSHFFGWIAFSVIIYMWSEILESIPLVTDYFGFSEDLRVESVEKIKRGSGRDIAWLFAWQNIQENIFMGHGLSSTEELFRRHIKELSILGHQGNAHNTFLTIWYDTGIQGLIAFVFGILTFFFKVGRSLSYAMPVLFAILFSIFYESWLSASLNPYTSLFFVIVTLLGYVAIDQPAMAAKKQAEEEAPIEQEESESAINGLTPKLS